MHKRIRVLNSYAEHARFLAACEDANNGFVDLGFIPRDHSIRMPYCYTPVHAIFKANDGRPVFICETSHRRYEVFTLNPGEQVYQTEQEIFDKGLHLQNPAA